MNIKDWPLDQVMQLPDHVFGRRFPLVFKGQVGSGAAEFAMSGLSLPDRAVLWEVDILGSTTSAQGARSVYGAGFAFATKLPTSTAEFAALPQFLPGSDILASGVPVFFLPTHMHNIRFPVAAMGQNVAVMAQNIGTLTINWIVTTIWSGIPNEVPDCVL
jgi:hypothetical protein